MKEIMEIIGWIANFAGIIGSIYSASIWYSLKREEKFNEQRITIRLKTPKVLIELPYAIERKYLTRSELQGLLGILPTKEMARYKLSFLNTKAFSDNLKAAQDDKNTSSIEIVCYEEEVPQFDLDKIKIQCTVTDIN
jgi:hypothetical protein